MMYDWSKRPPTPSACGCEGHSLFSASLIGLFCQSRDHVPASKCLCGRQYWSWRKSAWFDVKKD